MFFDKKDLSAVSAILPQLAKSPLLTMVVFALSIPMVLIYCSTKFVNAPVETLILFGSLGVCVLIYAAWIVNQLKTKW